MKEFKSITTFLNKSLPSSKEIPAPKETQDKLIASWSRFADSAAAFSSPLLFDSGKLVIFCDSPAWSTLLAHKKPSLLRQLKANDFPVTEIRIRVKEYINSSAIRTISKNKMRPMTDNQANATAQLAKTIENPALKNSLIRLSRQKPKS